MTITGINQNNMASKKFNFKTLFLDAEDKPVINQGEKLELSSILSNTIMNTSIQDGNMVIKFFDWGRELRKSGKLELDSTDEKSLRDWILNKSGTSVLIIGRLNEVLDNPEDAKIAKLNK